MKYYNGQQLDSYKDYNLRFCLGGRNIGKSTYWQIRFMAQAIRKKNKRKSNANQVGLTQINALPSTVPWQQMYFYIFELTFTKLGVNL